MSIKKPIFYSYDLCKKTEVDLLAIIHVDDRNTEVLEVAVTQGGEAVSMTGKTVIARFVSAKDHILFSDNVACSVNEAGNILVPFDNAVIQSRKCDLKIEVKIADGTDVLTLQFPLWVRVNGSILDTAEISPESQGTIPELLRSVLEELERVGEYVDENALFDAIDTAFTGGGTLVPSIAIDNDNQSGDYILYYVDGDFVRHDIFNFSQYFTGAAGVISQITEPYNLYDPCAAYTVTDASQTGKVGYSVDSGTGSITVTRAQGDGQKYIRYADKTLKAGTYTLSGKVTLHSNAADGNRTMCCNIGYEKTRQQVNLMTERGGSQNIGSSDKEGWFSCTVILSYDQVFSFEAIPWSAAVCNSNLPAVLSNVQIIGGADIGAYSPAARTSVDIKARTLIGKRGDEFASDIAASTTALKNRNGVIYTTATARHSYTVSSGGVINFTVGAKLNTRLYGDNVNSLDWNTVGSEISGSLTVNNETATIRLSDNKALVYNTTDKKLYIRSGTASASFKNDDILLIYNGYGVPLKGRLYDEYIERKAIDLQTTLTRSEIAAQSFNSAYHTGATDFASKCTEFSSLFYGDTIVPDKTAPADFESFLFFTDPHLLNGTGWESKCTEMIAQIQKYYNSTPTHFILCGGDWIGSNDLPSEACFKLGYINGFMSSMFDNCRMLVGNHDLNYQGKATAQSDRGTTRLSNQSISDLWYKGGKAYYSFDGLNTRFFCFDTGSDGDSMNAYFWEQAQWFANALDSENSNHIAIAVHILYKSLSANPKVMSPLTAQLLAIAQAFNNRGTVTVNGTSHNYEGKTGKIEFLLGGHTHADYNEVINGIPCVLTTQVKPSSASAATFDLVCVDYSAGKLKMIRIGDGSNREFSLSA